MPDSNDATAHPCIGNSRILVMGCPALVASQFPIHLPDAVRDVVASLPSRHGCLYALPKRLWNDLVDQVGRRAFTPREIANEDDLAKFLSRNPFYPGFCNGQPIFNGLLARPHHLLATEIGMAWGRRPAGSPPRAAMFIEYIVRAARAYAGWLMTNRQFVEEHDALLQKWSPTLAVQGYECVDSLKNDAAANTPKNNAGVNGEPCRRALQRFLARWQLRALSAPQLPLPLHPLSLADVSCKVDVNHTGLGIFLFPTTIPLPSGDLMRGILEHELRASTDNSHLQEWLSIVRTSRAARNLLPKFGRLFELQHYFRILQQRHRHALHRRATVLKSVLAKYLGAKARTIHSDLNFIAKRLGKRWGDG